MALRVGFAQVDITPEPGLPLMGNFRDDYAARGAHDPLYAKALVFDDGDVRLGLLALDVCMLDRDNVGLIRNTIAQQCQVPATHVLVHATHTHSAPAPHKRFLCNFDYEPHRPRIEALLRQAAGALQQAESALTPAHLSLGAAREDRVSFNRRLRRRDGSTQMNWEALAPGFDPQQIDGAWGPTDPEMLALRVEGEQGQRTALVNFALHPAILAGDNWLYSADYPGQLAASLSRICGPDFKTIFVNGCTGDVNHVDYADSQQGRGFGMVERVGGMLAVAAGEALRLAAPLTGASLGVVRERIELDRLPIGFAEYERCLAVLAAAKDRPAAGQVDGLPDVHFAEMRVQMYRGQYEPDQVEVMSLRVGDVAIVGLPGEVFCQIGMDIKRRSPARATMVVGLANDAVGYLPTRAAFDQGGYEPTVGSTFYQPGSAERLADAAVAQLHRLFASSPA